MSDVATHVNSSPMKDSGLPWVGMIPADWKVLPAGGVFTEVKEKNHNNQYSNPFSFRYGEIVDKKIGDIDESMEETLSAYRIVLPNTIMLNGLNLNYDFITQRVAIVQKKGIITSAYLAVKPDETRVVPRFMLYLLKSYDFRQVLHSIGSGIRKTLKYQDFKNLKIITPDMDTQRRLADYLDTKCSIIESVISETKTNIEEYTNWKHSVIYKAVTKGIQSPVTMKDSGIDTIGQIPAHWAIKRLKNIGTLQNGISKSAEYFGQGSPFVSYGDVYRNYSLPTNPQGQINSTEEEQMRFSVKYGDIFFTRTSETIEEVGFSSICEKTIPNATFAGFLIRFRPSTTELATEFAKYFFRSPHHRSFFAKEMNLVTRASLSQELLKSMPVVIPPEDEQKQIAKYLDEVCSSVDALIEEKQRLITELEAYKKSLIYEVVTGKRKVV